MQVRCRLKLENRNGKGSENRDGDRNGSNKTVVVWFGKQLMFRSSFDLVFNSDIAALIVGDHIYKLAIPSSCVANYNQEMW